MELAIVIPTHNRKKYLQNLLVCLKRTCPGEMLVSFIVIVDGSDDGTCDMLSSEFKDIHVIMGTGDWWFTRCINEGFEYARSLQPEYVLILNDDLVPDENFLTALFEYAKHPLSNAIVGSITLSMDDPPLVLSSGIKSFNRLTFSGKEYIRSFSKVNPVEMTGLKPTYMLTGRGTLIPVNVLNSLGNFDPFFVQYHSDGDYCLRALKKGFRVFINWDARIYTNISTTASVSSFLKVKFQLFWFSFFDSRSRNYIPQRALFIYRHGYKIFFPVSFMIFILKTFRAYFFKRKQNDD